MYSDNSLDSFMYVGSYVHSISLTKLEFVTEGVIVVSNGKIIFVQNHSNDWAKVQKIHDVKKENVHVLKKGQFLIPGFVDTHIHASQYPNIGLGYDLPLLEWLEVYTFPLESKFECEEFAKKVYDAVVKKTLANGTTTASYFATIHVNGSCVLVNSIHNFGQRAFVGKVNMNKNSFLDYVETCEESVSKTRDFVDYVLNFQNPRIKPIITPRFALSCDMNLLKALGKIADEYQLPIQTHVSENLDEISFVKKEFPECKNYVDVYAKAGLITNRTILAHGVHLEPDELKVIKEKGAKISHCANSNILLQSGICPVSKYLNSGLKVSLGSDCSGGNSCSILESIRQTLMLSIQAVFNKKGEKLSVEEAFYMATLGGAEAMCLKDVIGNFLPGKEFDAILVDLNDPSKIDLLEDYNLQQLFQKFIYLGNEELMKKVFVAGRVVKQL